MNKETWVKHIEEISGLERPSAAQYSGMNEHLNAIKLWKEFVSGHKNGCKLCHARKVTKDAAATKKAQNGILRELCGTSAAAARRDMGL
jgi:hypothetical protein